MADAKISALPASTTPLVGTEVLPIVQGGTTKQVSVANLTAGRAVSASSLTNAALTSGRVTYAGTSGVLQDSANLTFTGSNFGINVAPLYPLHVANPASTYLDTLAVFNELGTWNANGGLVLANYYSSTTLIAGIKFNSLTTTTGDISFHTNGVTERMRIGVTGDVTITTAGKGFTLPGGITWTSGAGSPEGVVTAPVGSLYSRSDGGVLTSLYVKQSGSGNTGWAGK